MVGTPLRRDATGFVLRAPTAWRMAGFPPEHLYRSAGCLRDGRVVQKLLYVLFAPTGAVFRSPPIESLHHRPARWRGGSALLAARSRCASIPSSSSGSHSIIRSCPVCALVAGATPISLPIWTLPSSSHPEPAPPSGGQGWLPVPHPLSSLPFGRRGLLVERGADDIAARRRRWTTVPRSSTQARATSPAAGSPHQAAQPPIGGRVNR